MPSGCTICGEEGQLNAYCQDYTFEVGGSILESRDKTRVRTVSDNRWLRGMAPCIFESRLQIGVSGQFNVCPA